MILSVFSSPLDFYSAKPWFKHYLCACFHPVQCDDCVVWFGCTYNEHEENHHKCLPLLSVVNPCQVCLRIMVKSYVGARGPSTVCVHDTRSITFPWECSICLAIHDVLYM